MARIVTPSASTSTTTTSSGYTAKAYSTDGVLFTTPSVLTANTDYGFGPPVQYLPAMSEDVVVFGITEGANNNTSGQSMYSLWSGEMIGFYGPSAPVIDSAGTMTFGNTSSGSQVFAGIYRLTAARQLSVLAGTNVNGYVDATGSAAQFAGVTSLALASDGNYYAVESNSNRLRKITPAGVVTTLAGSGSSASTDGTGTAASFSNPRTIVFNAFDNCLYVYDNSTYKVRRVTLAGVVTTVAGIGSATYANGTVGNSGITGAGQLASDGIGGIYFGDYQLIRKIDTTTAQYNVTVLAGSPNTAAHVDGTGGNARFYGPWGCVWDQVNQCLWVQDVGSGTSAASIRKVTAAGVTTSLTPAAANGTSTNGQFDGPTISTFTMSGGQSPLSVDPAGAYIVMADGQSARLRKINTVDGRITHVAGHNAGPANILQNITAPVTVASRGATVAGINITSVGKESWLPFPYPVRVPAGNKVWMTMTNLTTANSSTANVSVAWAPISLFQ